MMYSMIYSHEYSWNLLTWC